MGWIEWKKVTCSTNWINSLSKVNNIEKTIDQTNWEIKSVLKIKEKSFFAYLKQKLNFTETPQIASARKKLIESIRSWTYNSRAYINYDNLIREYIVNIHGNEFSLKTDITLSLCMIYIFYTAWKIERAKEDLDNLEFYEWYPQKTLVSEYIADIKKILDI